ncbi:MAG TPA: ferrochelatase, partial [Acetobacteraceae bacterium]|nr:ferrochelatase [Acetobacteraceae bacterium]
EKAEQGYAHLGYKSPLLELTRQQAGALEAALPDAKCFIAMRCWHPFASEAARAVKQYDPDRILLLPLYPQFSTTTSGSAIADWHDAAARAGLVKPTTTICCFYDDPAYVGAMAALVRRGIASARAELPPEVPLRLLFSAHGLPESIIKAGDPYQQEVEDSAAAVLAALGPPSPGGYQDHLVCYQSRATPQQWLEPSTDQAIEQAAKDRTAVLVIPIAFVSDHIETLVELDIDYRELAAHHHLPGYFRAPVPNADPAFIAALAGLASRALASGQALCSHRGKRACNPRHADCPWSRHDDR